MTSTLNDRVITDDGIDGIEIIDDSPVVAVPRRTIDWVLIALGAVAAFVFFVAGGLLLWGANFSNDYVDDELSSQNIFFPDEAALTEEGRDDLVSYAEEQVTTGPEAEAYASFIDGHLVGIADGMTFADLGAVEREAEGELEAAIENGGTDEEIAELEATAAGITGQRDSLFRGETLRGLLLSAFAWSTIGRIAGIAALVAFAAAIVMTALVVGGLFHISRKHT